MEQILLGDKGRIDFGSPIPMTPKQKNDFLALLRKLYSPVEEEYTSDFRSYRLGSREINARWTAEEYRTLLQINDYTTVAEQLGRTEMSIIMRVGAVIPRLMLWCDENNIMIEKISVQDIEKFLQEIEDKKLERRMQRNLRNSISRKIDKIRSEKPNPCMVMSQTFYGGECEHGFHKGCFTCPRSKKFIKNKEDANQFNRILQEKLNEE